METTIHILAARLGSHSRTALLAYHQRLAIVYVRNLTVGGAALIGDLPATLKLRFGDDWWIGALKGVLCLQRLACQVLVLQQVAHEVHREVLVLASLIAIVMTVLDASFLQFLGYAWLREASFIQVKDGVDGRCFFLLNDYQVATIRVCLVAIGDASSCKLAFKGFLLSSSVEAFLLLYDFLLGKAAEDGEDQRTHRVELGSVGFFQ